MEDAINVDRLSVHDHVSGLEFKGLATETVCIPVIKFLSIDAFDQRTWWQNCKRGGLGGDPNPRFSTILD